MSATNNTDFTYWDSGSLQPDLPYNINLLVLDALLNLSPQDKDLTTPPTTVSGDIGKTWIVAASATGRWSGKDGQVAICSGVNVDEYRQPQEGWLAYVRDEDASYIYDGSAWVAFTPGGGGGGSSDAVTVVTPASGVATIDLSLGDYYTLAPTANVTSIVFTNLPGSGKGATKMVRFTQDTTPRTVAWPASFKWAGGTAGAVSTVSGAIDVLAITTFDNGTTWDATLAKAFA